MGTQKSVKIDITSSKVVVQGVRNVVRRDEVGFRVSTR